MNKKLLLLLLSGALFLSACNDEESNNNSDKETTSEATEDTNSESEESNEETNNEEKVFDIGETIDLESYEWEVPYQVTVKSVDVTREYNGEDINDYIINAHEADNFFVAKTVIKNTSDEPMIPGEYVVPTLGRNMNGNGEDFVFELSEEQLSKELASGEEIELDFVFLENLESVEDPDGNLFLHFEGYTDNQKSYVVPTK
ncbi:hypothetical protein GCM10007358_12300 [Phocicoccus schoeneichii]|uniref:Telomeric repeat-binding factor 2 n=1 Tax=Phocicoccus schoeneichii TaxID=1812261 RepID=A0A6V7R9B6_9BACL|nr:hypothetical protein [Jeotgalicoccus schoeneichii]GGH53200.1 hypothetical protein GCM10007358_12300 [Jeotgalicoccus schoeneichii]CAD2073941.1 hypothetical protein JEOSCH030_00590 [Jeotgalicoccus schoeneichii]